LQSTTSTAAADQALRQLTDPSASAWARLARALPADLDAHAAAAGALVRKRGIACAADLLRILLASVLLDWSLRLVGAWCLTHRLCDLSHVALLKLTRRSTTWVQQVLGHLLHLRQAALPTSGRIRLIDATVISRPGSRGTDWRCHLEIDLATAALTTVALTDAQGGESLTRFAPDATAVKVADRGYCAVSSLLPDLVAGTPLIVRCTWQAMRLEQADGTPLDVLAWLKEDPTDPVRECQIWVTTAQGRFALRLVRAALPQEQADRAREKLRKAYRKNGRTPQEGTLVGAGFVVVLTTVPATQWSGAAVLAVYRLRWQIELRIKRLKSLMTLDGLRARTAATAQTYLLTKLLAAVLVETLSGQLAAQRPAWWESTTRPVSLWRVEQWWWEQLRQWVVGPGMDEDWVALLPRLQRYLCDSPRRRPQLAHARRWLHALFGADC
jgi:hypothetical protein